MTDKKEDKKEDKISRLEKKVEMLEKKLSMTNASFLNMIGRSLDAIVILDADKMVVYSNYAALTLFDKDLPTLMGETFHIDLDVNASQEIQIPQCDGSTIVAEINVINTEWNNKPGILASFRDITERKESEAMLTYLSEHDYLTDLPNRVFFEKKLSESMYTARHKKMHMALLYIDIDNFKIINDTLGHGGGDKLLKHLSGLLRDSICQWDLAARLGGDEFAIILDSVKKPQYAGQVAQSLINKIQQAVMIDGKHVYPSASIGIAVYPMGGTTSLDLIKNADAAMYAAKKQGKTQYQYFTTALNQQNERAQKIIEGLQDHALEEQLFLEYQPIIDIPNNTFYAIEALVRWSHPTLGIVMPDAFLPFAEDSGMMIKIGKCVLKKALQDLSQLDQTGLKLSVNMSVNELENNRLPEEILKYIRENNIPSKRLIIEITETAVMKHPELAVRNLNNLSDIGIHVAIDDYGTGYSSLSYLKQLPVSLLKIDRSFVRDIGLIDDDTVIVESTIKLAHNLGLKVVAEGIETQEQLDFLNKNQCDYGQGYFFSKPTGIKNIKSLIDKFNKQK